MTDGYESRLRGVLATIAKDWDDALDPLPVTSAGGKVAGPGSRPPLPVGSLSVRAELWEFLASWKRLTDGWFDDEPAGVDVPSLARWFASHADVLVLEEVIRDELDQADGGLEALAKELHLAANPPAPKGPALGECPACHDMVRWVPLKAVACCGGCGTCRPWREWKSILGVTFPVGEPVPTPLVVAFVAAEYGRLITGDQLRQWAARAEGGPGRRATGVRRHGKNDRGQTLFSLAEVGAWCEHLWKESQLVT